MAQLDTSIDRLVEYVKLKGNTSVNEASKALQISQKEIEELSEILAESGLINLKYEFSGIRLFTKAPKADAAKPAAAPKDKTVLERFTDIEKELQGASDLFIFSEKDLTRRLGVVQAHFRDIERTNLSAEENDALRRMSPALISEAKGFEEKIELLKKQAAALEAEVIAFQARLEMAPPARRGILHKVRSALSGISSRVRRKRARQLPPATPLGEQPAPPIGINRRLD